MDTKAPKFAAFGVLILLAGLLLAACSSSVSNLKKPEIRLLDAEVVRARLLEQELLLYFEIDNPNNISLPVKNLDYRVHLNGVLLADGHSRARFEVPARGKRTFEVPVHTNLWRNVRQFIQMEKNPDVPVHYSLQGSIKTSRVFGKKVYFSRQGQLTPGDYIKDR